MVKIMIGSFIKKSGLIILIFLISQKILADTHYVSPSGGNSYPYTSWANAANNIQDAVDASVSNDLVLVADGVYDSGGALTPAYGLSNRVMVNKPIEVRSVNGPESTIILGKGPVGSSSVRCAYLTNDAILTGFTLKNGFADSLGGGVCLDHGCIVSNCVITQCERRGVVLYWDGLLIDSVVSSNSYGGVYIGRDGRIEGCVIKDNYDITNRYGTGGGIYISMNGIVERCIISGNRLTGDRSEGGGVYFGQEPTYTDSAIVRFSRIVGNSAEREGGGVRATGNEYTWTRIDNCVICSNYVGDSGGGVSFWYGGRVNDCSVFANSAGWGGGFYFFASSVNPVQRGEARNCTIVNNSAWMHGGGVDNNGPSVVYNSIIYFNEAPGGTNYDSYTTFQSCCSDPQPVGTDNITGDPLFQDIYSADFHLLEMSPCINAGSNALTNGPGKFDIDGLQRILGGTVNMGCYEQNRDPDIPPPAINTQLAFSGLDIGLFSYPVTNIVIDGTKTANKFTVTLNEFGGWVTNDVKQILSGSVWTNILTLPIGSSNTFYFRQADSGLATVSTGFVSQTVVIIPEPTTFLILNFGFWILFPSCRRARVPTLLRPRSMIFHRVEG